MDARNTKEKNTRKLPIQVVSWESSEDLHECARKKLLVQIFSLLLVPMRLQNAVSANQTLGWHAFIRIFLQALQLAIT
jgi:hypothetical protein